MTSEDGTWSVTPTGFTIENNLLISSETTTAGNYQLTFSLTNTIGVPMNCPLQSTVDFEVFQSLGAEVTTDVSVCNLDTGNGPDFIDLDDLFISGSQGMWTTNEALSIDADNVVSFTGADLRDYTFFYSMSDPNSPCPDVTIPVNIRVRDCACPELSIDNIPTVCNTDGPVDLNAYLVNPENEAGLWSISGPDDSALIGTSFFPDGIPAGDYTLTFTFTDPVGGSCESSADVLIVVNEPPSSTVVPMVEVCNGTSITVFPTNIDLTSLVTGSAGMWTAPNEFRNGVIDDETDVDFTDVDPGSYFFEFTTNTALAPCAEQSYFLEVIVRNCNCPFATFIPPVPLCNDGPDVDLNDYLEAGSPEGTWSFTNGTPNVEITNGSIISLSDLDGFYLFTYTLDEVPTGCPDLGQINLEIVSPPEINHIDSETVCIEDNGSNPVCINLFDFVTGVSGTWEFPPEFNGDRSDTTNVCFDMEESGIMEFTFLTDGLSPTCEERSYVTRITVNDCNCPNTDLLPAPAMCNDSDQLDLVSLIVESSQFWNWSLIDGPSNIDVSANVFDASGANPGMYTLQYEVEPGVGNFPPDCVLTNTLEIEVVGVPNAGQALVNNYCVEDNETVVLIDLLTGADQGGTWSSQNFVSGFDADAGTFTGFANEPGMYSFTYTLDNASPCPVAESTVNLTVLPNSSVTIENSPCADDNSGSIIIASINTGGSLLYSIDNGQTWTQNPIFNNLPPGSYTVLIEDENGCQMAMSNLVVSEPGPFSIDAGEDREIEAGNDFVTLQIATTTALDDIASIVWTEDGNVICSGGVDQCLIIEVDPDGVSEYCATVTDINGCVTEDCVFIRERIVKDVYIPNAINLFAGGQNDVFFVQADEFVEVINSMRIYDRWGELMYVIEDHNPNDKSAGWDGTYNDIAVEQGVYVYMIELTYTDGQKETFVGDLTIFR